MWFLMLGRVDHLIEEVQENSKLNSKINKIKSKINCNFDDALNTVLCGTELSFVVAAPVS